MVLRFRFNCAIIPLAEKKQHLGVAQLVARYLGVVEAVGSSPVTQTKYGCLIRHPYFFAIV